MAAAAYRARTCLHDQRTGIIHDYTRYKGGPLLAEACLAPDGRPVDREALWNAAELKNNKPNAIPAREIEVALPAELPPEDQTALAVDYAKELAQRYGVGVDVAVHGPDPKGDERNVHAHLLLSYCSISLDQDGRIVAGKKVKELDFIHSRYNWGPSLADTERPRWAELCNEALERAGVLERVDHRSLAAQGIDRVPGVHLGPQVMAMMRKGIETDRGAMAQEATEALEIEEWIERIEKELASLEKPIPKPFSFPRRGSRTHKMEATGTSGLGEEEHPSKKALFSTPIPDEILQMALGDPKERVKRCQAFRLPERDPASVEALKKGRLDPAMVVMDGEGVAVVLKADRALTREARERLTREVQRVVPGIKEMDLPDRGLVLEAKGVVFSKAREILREVKKGRAPEL